MYMDKGMDTGDIIEKKEIEIEESDNLTTLTNKLSILGSSMICDVIRKIEAGTNERVMQDNSLATYTKMITKEDEHLDFDDTSKNIFNKVRSLADDPASYVMFNDNQIKIYSGYILKENASCMPGTIVKLLKNGIAVKTKDFLYVITKLKPSGKKEMDARSYINGLKENIIGESYE